jgi:hypothetical protein
LARHKALLLEQVVLLAQRKLLIIQTAISAALAQQAVLALL